MHLIEIVTQTEYVTVERALEQMGFFGRYKDILEVLEVLRSIGTTS